MSGLSPITKARMRPAGSRKETFIWVLMRLTGLGLFVLALAHFSILHFIFDPAEQDVEFIKNERWNQLFWRVFDWSLLMLVLFHSFLGMRTVVQDSLRSERARRVSLWVLYVLAVVLFVLGSWVVITLPGLGGGS
jgi:succinate dehydrogenase / fumarate reductase, membrane anchor subunit